MALVPHAAAATPVPAAEPAQPAERFVGSMCVNTHFAYAATPYARHYAAVRDRLIALGIHHVRDYLTSRVPDLYRHGIALTAIADTNAGTPQAIHAAVARLDREGLAVDAVEGPNEPDIFWPAYGRHYHGDGTIRGVIAYQRDLYRVFKSDPATARLTIIGPALGKTYPLGASLLAPHSLTRVVDWGNMHPYPIHGNQYGPYFSYDTIGWYLGHGNSPGINMDGHPSDFDLYAPPFGGKPMAATETGYFTGNAPESVSEQVEAAYVPRLFLEYFRLHITRTCLYELVDERPDPAVSEANYGLLRYDLSPKPAYTLLRRLTSLLSDPGPPFHPGRLRYTLSIRPGYTRPEFVHHLLLQKRNGVFYLVLWNEMSDGDTTDAARPARTVRPPAATVSIHVQQHIGRVAVYALDRPGALRRSVMSASLTLRVGDVPCIVALSP